MSDIFNEIQESISEAKKGQILSRFVIGIFITGVLIVIYLGIDSWYENRKRENIQRDGAILTQSVNSINFSKKDKESVDKQRVHIEKLEKLAEGNNSSYSALANIYLASTALMDNNPSKALYYYQRIAKDSSYDSVLREYSELVEINAKLQFNKGVQNTAMKQIYDYFQPYITDGKLSHDVVHEKSFSNGMALTGIALSEESGKAEDSALYLQALQESEAVNENTTFVIDLLAQYIAQKNNLKKQNETK